MEHDTRNPASPASPAATRPRSSQGWAFASSTATRPPGTQGWAFASSVALANLPVACNVTLDAVRAAAVAQNGK